MKLPDRYLLSVAFVWCALVLLGISILAVYSNTPGETRARAEHWPSGLPFDGTDQQFQLVMTVHPHCPCSGATIEELARLILLTGTGLRAVVLLYSPDGADAQWADGGLGEVVERIPGVVSIPDPGGRLKNQFGLTISGESILYDRDGRLVFAGGITAARGHQGVSDGRITIQQLVGGRSGEIRETPAYGCAVTRVDASCLSGEDG